METRLSILFYGKKAKITKEGLMPIYSRVTIGGMMPILELIFSELFIMQTGKNIKYNSLLTRFQYNIIDDDLVHCAASVRSGLYCPFMLIQLLTFNSRPKAYFNIILL